ncbi:hypothetical protein IPM62_05180 [Candidatus Woesebacteria bacterium]|nr:MAG: hypothetical protein IPM62_05180 [Candidatus Woesebacteria bacterium]
MEILVRNTELQNVVTSATTITGSGDLTMHRIPHDALMAMTAQVSDMIVGYNNVNPGEMLPKSPEALLDQFKAGETVMMITKDHPGASGEWTVLYHGTMYPALNTRGVAEIGMQVVEFGSAITHPNYRGCSIGSLGGKQIKQKAGQMWGEMLGIATIKQAVTAWAFNKGAEMEPLNFSTHPYLSYLTCSCINCSERVGLTCGYRRRHNQSDKEGLEHVLDRSQGPRRIPCTLIATNTIKAECFEERCRQLHASQGRVPIEPGESSISLDAFGKIGEFFGNLIN